jgi:hypothetical protein
MSTRQLFETVYANRLVTAHIVIPGKGRFPNLQKVQVPQRGPVEGIMVAVKNDDGSISIGWSEFNPEDKTFNRKIGKEIALCRAMGIQKDIPIMTRKFDKATQKPYDAVKMTLRVDLNQAPNRRMAKALAGFERRAARYFKVEKCNVHNGFATA